VIHLETSDLILLLISALAPFVTAILAARSWTSGQKGGLTAVLCLAISLVANWQAGTLELVPILTAYLAALGAAQTAWLVQRPVDVLGAVEKTILPRS